MCEIITDYAAQPHIPLASIAKLMDAPPRWIFMKNQTIKLAIKSNKFSKVFLRLFISILGYLNGKSVTGEAILKPRNGDGRKV